MAISQRSKDTRRMLDRRTVPTAPTPRSCNGIRRRKVIEIHIEEDIGVANLSSYQLFDDSK